MRFATTQVDQFLTGVHLEAVRGIAAEHTRLQDGFRGDARSTRDGGVSDFYVGIFLVVQLEQGVQGGAFVACPPREDLQLAAELLILGLCRLPESDGYQRQHNN